MSNPVRVLTVHEIYYGLKHGGLSLKELKLAEEQPLAPGVTVGDYLDSQQSLNGLTVDVENDTVRYKNADQQ